MKIPNLQLETPIDAIIFDCDGTLTRLEGVDELAAMNGVGEIVAAMTAEAMGQSGINPDLYQKRLSLIKPTQQQLHRLGQDYCDNATPEAKQVIGLLQRLHKKIYIASAGLLPAVEIFASFLNVPQKDIFAVNIYFDTHGNYLDFDHNSPLIHRDGKREIITQLKHHPSLIHIGDGLNDHAVYDLVTRFIGYGGVFYRENIARRCDFYTRSPSLSALLPLCLTQLEYECMNLEDKRLYEQGLELNRIHHPES